MRSQICILPLAEAFEPGPCLNGVYLHGHRLFGELLLEQQPAIVARSGLLAFKLNVRMIEQLAAALDLPTATEARPDGVPPFVGLEVLRLEDDSYHDHAILQPLYRKVVQDLRDAAAEHGELLCLMNDLSKSAEDTDESRTLFQEPPKATGGGHGVRPASGGRSA